MLEISLKILKQIKIKNTLNDFTVIWCTESKFKKGTVLSKEHLEVDVRRKWKKCLYFHELDIVGKNKERRNSNNPNFFDFWKKN